MTLGIFLLINGLYLDATEAEAEETIYNLAAGLLTEEELGKWLRSNCGNFALP